jgi:hypothetical protein
MIAKMINAWFEGLSEGSLYSKKVCALLTNSGLRVDKPFNNPKMINVKIKFSII